MTPKEAEEYVRARWKRVYGGGEIAVTVYAEEKACHFLNYIAAAEFTKQREEEIRKKRAECNHVRCYLPEKWDFLENETVSAEFIVGVIRDFRILAVLEAQLATLLVGWKEKP